MEVEVGGGRKAKEEEKKKGSSCSSFYECNFCKRGFTNPQALGGHMNIHRKDKSKPLILPAKPKSKQTLIHPSNYIHKPSYMFYPKDHHSHHPGFDLSLQIGSSSSMENQEINDGEAVDLELRLGRP